MGGPKQQYLSLVETGALEFDASQACIADELQALRDRLSGASGIGSLRRLNPFASKRDTPPGLYLYGAVGCGKTMLMDLFFESAAVVGKRRLHFQQFMTEAHAAIERARQSKAQDAVSAAARELSRSLSLLCLDELEITDIADAMVIGRLFQALFGSGVIIVATSNSAPRDLYKGGLNRQLFLPFIGLIEEHMRVLPLNAARDYRLARLTDGDLYVTPLGIDADAALDRSWDRLTGGAAAAHESIQANGRQVEVRKASGGIARFDFDELCEAALGPEDYQRLSRRYRAIIIDRIPILGPERRNAARRFTTLIDALYDNRVGLIVSAAAEPGELYRGDDPEGFLRTASRLIEMRSSEYLGKLRQESRQGNPAGRTPG